MAPRANKRQQREQEELMILSGSTAAEESSGEEDVLVQSKSAFAAVSPPVYRVDMWKVSAASLSP